MYPWGALSLKFLEMKFAVMLYGLGFCICIIVSRGLLLGSTTFLIFQGKKGWAAKVASHGFLLV